MPFWLKSFWLKVFAGTPRIRRGARRTVFTVSAPRAVPRPCLAFHIPSIRQPARPYVMMGCLKHAYLRKRMSAHRMSMDVPCFLYVLWFALGLRCVCGDSLFRCILRTLK